ncbi:phosphatidylglycerol lysyltransferase domain-containing protein [Streptacidiphilus cavernicola]|uniref:Phosphatidylglycerol lysyltransferase domain-containing protein n=1 Tax=Streptacidiphilus cavernicola TaxID=3342716 RepID=A0ABV6VWY0_9ACTN
MSEQQFPEGPQRKGIQLPKVSRPWAPAAVGYATALVGLGDIVGAVAPHFRGTRVHELASFLPGTVTRVATAASLVVGILLIMLAHALRRRKQRAWQAVAVLLPVGFLLEALRWHHTVTAAVTLVVFVVVLVNRREFYALSDPRTRWRALWNFLAMSLISFGLGLVIVSSHARTTLGTPSFGDRFWQVAWGLIGVGGPIHYTMEDTNDLVYYSLAGLGLFTAVSTLWLATKPSKPVAELSVDEEAQVRGLLTRHGARDSLGYFALRRDKSVVFSPSGKAAIAYRVVSGVMLASGDPIGDVEAWPGAIKVFMDEAHRHAWVPAVMGCSETGGEVWTREAGLDALEIGDEAVVEVADFTLEGRAMRNVRQMVKRIERSGYTCRVRRVDELSEAELVAIRHAADAWRGTETERGFSMALGRFGDPADEGCVVVTAHKLPDGALEGASDIRAVLHFVPWGRDGISLELMRRDRDADPGLNELLIVKALEAGPGLGVSRVSLNFAMFRSALARGERIGAGPVLRAWRGLLVFLSRWFQIESLYKFNAKFRPIWEPRFLVYPTARDLPRIGISALQAEAFIVMEPPKFLRRLRRGGPAPAPRVGERRAADPALGEPGLSQP